jgi:hypothetical protein
MREPEAFETPGGRLSRRRFIVRSAAPAIALTANAVYHATGVRVRELPILPDKLLAE